MKIYDISQELFSCVVFPGDCAPEYTRVLSMENGDACNLTELAMNAHNGTHVDAPAHFVRGGATIDMLPIERFVGKATVVGFDGLIGKEEATALVASHPERLLVRGSAEFSLEGAQVLAQSGIVLLGCESQTYGRADEIPQVHRALLGADIILLEGARLAEVPDGEYLLCAAPINLGGCEGAPCRAVLIDQ